MEKFKKLFLLLFLMSISSASALTNYCAAPRNSTSQSGAYTINYTCRNVGGTTYEFKLEYATAITGIYNANIGANPGPINIGANLAFSNGNKTLSYQFTAASTPSLYVAIIFLNIGGTEVRWDLPTDANFAANCGGLPPPTIGSLTVASPQTLGAGPFTLTQPTSNSSGAFTYTSSNTGVATISGNTVTIVGGGTTTITANQAASATYSSGSTSAPLVINLPNTTPSAGPTTPPARNPWDVLSQYGSAYTNQPGVVFDSFGGSTIVGNVTLGDGSVVKKYTAHSFSGISGNGALSLNVSAMTHLHMDVWSPDFASFKIKLEAVNGTNRELEVPGAKVQGSWNSYEIPLSNYTTGGGPVDLTNLKWIVPVTFNPNNTTLYITNVYFYRPATTQPPTLGTFTVPAANVGAAPFTLTPPSSNSTGTWSYTSSNTSVATISGNVLTIVGGGTSTITATQAAAGAYGPGTATATFVASYPAPGASPTPPARDPEDVVSMFTGTPAVYANSVTAVRAPWSNGATTLTTVSNGANTALQVNNMGFLGYVTNGANFSVVGMTKLHVDVYLNAPLPSLFIFLLAPGDNIYTATNLGAGWNSLDIDLSNYTGANLSNIYGLKFESNSSPSAFQMYLDNIYFYVPAGIDPTITDFNIPAKVFGDAPFELTPPNSNSPGSFTYTSSNTGVATVSGSTVTLVGPGSSTITAYQAANGAYEAGSITATLIVSNPPLAIAAPTPPARNEWDVISLYSNAYTTQYSPFWYNQSTLTDEQLQGNDTKKMSNFLVEILDFDPINLTPMTTLHMDVYSDDCTGMNIWLLNNGDRNAQISLLPNQWNSINIPLSTYAAQGLIMNGVHLLKFESLNGPGKTVYVDNIYFYRPATLLPPTLTDFTIPAKTFGDPDFILTPPNSNSSGAFTYTSSNPAVATVSGNTVHIVAGGTTTITATQAANGSYGSGTITAQLIVAFPAPGPSPVPPARTPERVVSMYTGTPPVYADAITAARSVWTGGTTLTEVPNGTNTALRLDNFGFLGLVDQNETHFSVVGMSHLHLDIYLNEPLNTNPELSRVFIFLLSNGDHLYNAANLVAGWNSLSIPLSNFPGANLADVYGLKFEQNSSSPTQIYIDNLYFSNECYTYYEDADNDGFGNPAVSQFNCTGVPSGYVLNNTDCNDAFASVNPGAAEILYDGVDNNCNNQLDEGNQMKTKLLPSVCGTALASIGSLIGITTVNSTITGYRIKATNGAQVQIIERNVPHFTLPNLGSYSYETTYTIEIELQRNGIWLGYYGDPCLVSSPAILAEGGAAQVSPSQCGITLARMNTLIATTSLQGATGYRFKVTNITAGASGPNLVQIIDRPLHWFSLVMLTQYNYQSTYRVEVAIKTNGAYSGYGNPCEVNSPAAPTLINCNAVVATAGSNVAATSQTGVTQYRFQITRISDNSTTTIDRNVNYFRFALVPGYTPAAQYAVRVAVMTVGTWSPFGDACQITSPGASARFAAEAAPETIVSAFKAVAYPNPFASAFAINVTTSAVENVQVKVYDMTGRLIDSREANTADVNSLQVGERYPSGVYNLVVTQGANVETLRVIKR